MEKKLLHASKEIQHSMVTQCAAHLPILFLVALTSSQVADVLLAVICGSADGKRCMVNKLPADQQTSRPAEGHNTQGDVKAVCAVCCVPCCSFCCFCCLCCCTCYTSELQQEHRLEGCAMHAENGQMVQPVSIVCITCHAIRRCHRSAQ
jgi:hypothetical protein